MNQRPCLAAAGVVMLISVDLAARERVCADVNRSPTVDILVVDYAQVPPTVLLRAEEKVTAAYRKMGVETTWQHAEPRSTTKPAAPVSPQSLDGNGRLSIAILSPIIEAGRDTGVGVLGAAPRTDDASDREAYLFFSRIVAVARGRGIDEAQILAYVMAHEIGHLLLPAGEAHTNVGIMRTRLEWLNLRSIVGGFPTFPPRQADSIRAALSCR